jgi:hypothetical protein
MIEIVAACITACKIICIHWVHYESKKALKVSVAYSDSSDTDDMQMFTSTCVPHLTQRDKSEQSPRQRGPTATASTTDSTNNAALFSDDEGATVQPASQRGVGGSDARGTNLSLIPLQLDCLLLLVVLFVCLLLSIPFWQLLFDFALVLLDLLDFLFVWFCLVVFIKCTE